MSDPMFSPDSGLSSLSEESRQTTSSHRRKQELIVLEDVEEMQTFGFGETLAVPDGIDGFFTDSLDDYVAQEEVVLSEDADNVGVLSLTDRSNKCFEEFMQIGEDSARGNEVENRAGVARDALSNLLAESGIQFYSPAAAAAGPSGGEGELGMTDLLNDAEPEPEEQTSHFVRRSQRKRSVRLEEPVEEDSEEDCAPRRKGGRSKSRRRGRSWSRRARSQPPEERAHQQQHHQSPLQPGTQQQFLLQQSSFLPQQQQQQQSQELQQQQQFQPLQQQLQFPQLQLFQQFPQQQHQLSQQMAQQQQQQQFIQLQPPPMPQQQQAQQEQPQPTAAPRQLLTLPAVLAADSSNPLLSSWNDFMFTYVQKLPKELVILLDDRLNARLLGQLPPIQRKPGWLEELLQD